MSSFDVLSPILSDLLFEGLALVLASKQATPMGAKNTVMAHLIEINENFFASNIFHLVQEPAVLPDRGALWWHA